MLTLSYLQFCYCSFTDNRRPSPALSQPYSYSLVNFMNSTAMEKGGNRDGKQVLSSNDTYCTLNLWLIHHKVIKSQSDQ